MHYCVFNSSKVTFSLIGYPDYNWAGDTSNRRPIAWYIFKLGLGLVSWFSNKFRTHSLCLCESVYKETKEATKEAMWIWHVLTELGLVHKSPIKLRCENKSAI